MSLWSSISNAVSSAANAVADAVETVVNAVAEAVSDVVETVGNAIEDACDAVGDVLDQIPIVGGFLGGIFHWAGDIVSGGCDLVASVIKAVGSIVGGVVGGLIKVVGGILSLNGSLIIEGLGDIVSGIVGAIVLIFFRLVELVQIVIRPAMQLTGYYRERERSLTKAEQELLKDIFQKSVALYNVRVVEGHVGWFGWTSWDGFTVGNTIYTKANAIAPYLLVHECLHVWQYQNWGSRYLTDAAYAQVSQSGYDWGKELASGKTDWLQFNAESEARFVEDLYSQGELLTMPPLVEPGAFFHQNATTPGRFIGTVLNKHLTRDPVGGTDYTTLANKTMDEIRGVLNTRLSVLFQ